LNSQKKLSQINSQPSSNLSIKGIVGSLWLIIFFVIFFSQILPNAGNNFTRFKVWTVLDQIYLNIFFPSAEIAANSGWRYFPQRLDIILIAIIIYAAAWGAGNLILRAINWNAPKNFAEKTVIVFGLGLSALSLFTLGMGKIGFLNATAFYTIFIIVILSEIWLKRSDKQTSIQKNSQKKPAKKSASKKTPSKKSRVPLWCLIGISPFLLAMALGAMLPSISFDIREYHLQGPKEYFQSGYIGMLPHNVYTSFPFFTEMLSLLGMVLRNDWYWGAICGKAVLMGFAPLTALALYAAGNRWFSKETGWIAALIFLTIPWTYRLSIIAFSEGGITFFLFASLFALMLTLDSSENSGTKNSNAKNKGFFVTGLLAGSAMACKYPGVIQVVIPLGVAVTLSPFFGNDSKDKLNRALKSAAIYSLAVFITIGPWLLKNTIETGNPVYPLLYSVFDGEDWDEQLNQKWKNAHSSKDYPISDIPVKLFDVTVKSDWLSPLLFGLAPLTLLKSSSQKKRIILLWIFVGYLFATWWLLTHRLDRFWVPLIPVVALLSGIGFHFSSNSIWKYTSRTLLVAALVYNLAYISTEACGYNGYLTDYKQARKMTEGLSSGIQHINQNFTENNKVLCIGEAAVFDSKIPLIYNTVFDYSIFEQWFSANDPSLPPEKQEFKSAKEIKSILKQHGVTHLLVNWAEILRYREEGSYGYTSFVMPERFQQLQDMGIISPPHNLNYLSWDKMDKKKKTQFDQWGQALKLTPDNKKIVISTQIYKTLD
jgi:Dolichyl-phosphate-mannose-protein mannosyltransferase